MNRLSLDISTSTVGSCLWNQNKPALYFAVDLSKHESLFDKLDEFKRQFILNMKPADQQIKEILIEEPFTFFSSGRSNANTMAKLSAFNCLISNWLREEFQITPTYVNVNSIRSKVGLNQLYKQQLADTKKKKKQLNCEFVERKFGIELKKSTNKNAKYKYHASSEDVSDAIIVGMGDEIK